MTRLDRYMVIGMILGVFVLLATHIFLLSKRVYALESQDSVRVMFEHVDDEFYNNEN